MDPAVVIVLAVVLGARRSRKACFAGTGQFSGTTFSPNVNHPFSVSRVSSCGLRLPNGIASLGCRKSTLLIFEANQKLIR